MRRTGPIRFFVQGDEKLAAQYFPIARKIAGYLQNQADLLGDKQWTATRKVRITDGTIIDVQKIGELLYNAYIDVRGALPGPITKALQYQFVYTGGAGKLWDIGVFGSLLDGVPIAGGSAVGVVFLMRENTVDYVALPLASTLLQPEEDEWLFIEDMGDPWQYTAWVESLLIPRHEAVLLPSQHLQQPDEDNLIHTAWMPKGGRHYLAQAFNHAILKSQGILAGSYQWRWYTAFPDPLGPGVPTLTYDYIYKENFYPPFSATDVGFEAELNVYQPPVVSRSRIEAGPVKGTTHRSAPDTDWYTSYGMQTVDLPDGTTRKYGVFIDASQRVHVWPIQAAGTGERDPAFISQGIKTNVSSFYTQSADISFPDGVRRTPGSFRDIMNSETLLEVDLGPKGPFGELERYIWFPHPEGNKFCTVLERETGSVLAYDFNRRTAGQTQAVPIENPKLYFVEDVPYRPADPVVGEVEVHIHPYGQKLEEFHISVSPVSLVETDLFPVQARYSSAQSFDGVEKGQLLVGGFRVRRLADSVESWDHVVTLSAGGGVDTLFGPSTNRPITAFSVNAFGPRTLPPHLNMVVYAPSGNTAGDWLFFNRPTTPLHLTQEDMGRVLDRITTATEFHPFGAPPDMPLCFINEGEFVVERDGEEVFSKCCRKFLENEHWFGNFFTAQISSLDLSTGSMVMGLCKSSTYCSGVNPSMPIQRYPDFHWELCVTGPDGQIECSEQVELGRRRDISGHWLENTTENGYAVFSRGALLTYSDGNLASYLDSALTSFILDKDLKFIARLRGPTAVSVVPGHLDTFNYWVQPDGLDYISDLVTAGIASSTFGGIGIPQFPWGLETYAWFAHNHFYEASGNQTGNLLAGEDLMAYTGTYLDIKSSVKLDAETYDLLHPLEVEMKHIDILNVAGFDFSHKELYEAAFPDTAKLDYNIEVESQNRSEPIQNGYPVITAHGSAFNHDDAYLIFPIFNPYIRFKTEEGENVTGLNMLLPNNRIYCNTAVNVGDFFYPKEGDPYWWYRSRGAVESPFRGAAYSLVDIQEE